MRDPASSRAAAPGRSPSPLRKMGRPSPPSNSASTQREECDMLARWIDWCTRNRFLVFTGTLMLVLAGIWSLRQISLDALPDISDVEVIVHTPWAGQPPTIIAVSYTHLTLPTIYSV